MSNATTIRLTGTDAIDYAEEHGRSLSKYTDPVEEAREGLTPDEAREIAREDCSLIYITLTADDLTALAIAHEESGSDEDIEEWAASHIGRDLTISEQLAVIDAALALAGI